MSIRGQAHMRNANGQGHATGVFFPDDFDRSDMAKCIEYANENLRQPLDVDCGYFVEAIVFEDTPIDWKEVKEKCGDDEDMQMWFVAGKYGRARAVSAFGSSAYFELYDEEPDYDDDDGDDYGGDYEEDEEDY